MQCEISFWRSRIVAKSKISCLKKLVLGKNASKMDVSKCFLNVEKEVATIKQIEVICQTKRRTTRNCKMERGNWYPYARHFIETILPIWRRRGKDVNKLGMSREDRTLLSPGSPIRLCYLHN